MQALEVLAFGPSTASRIAVELRVHPRTARRLLNRMVHDGWLIRHDGPRPSYAATLRIVALAAQFTARQPLLAHAAEPAIELHAATGCSVHLATPSYRSTVRLLRVRDGRVEMTRNLAPANATAAGKLLLAYRPGWQDAVLAAPLEARAEHTLVDLIRLRDVLGGVRSRGLASEDGEYRVDRRAIAVPVLGQETEPLAALAISWPRATAPDPRAIRGALQAAATRIGTSLSGRRAS